MATAGTWANAPAGRNTTTMNLSTALRQFTIGNASSQVNSFTNTSSSGLGNFTLPAVDLQTVSAGVFTINDTADVDAGSFSQGATDSHIDVTFDYTPLTTSTVPSRVICNIGRCSS